MKSYTAHIKPDCPPVLLPEGWSWGAAIFGPFWLLAHRAWIPALLLGAVIVLVQVFAPLELRFVIGLGLGVLSGLLGHDAVRWSLERRDYLLAHVLVARDEEGALARLLQTRTDLNAVFIGQLG
jgi:Protein of unknown function (DUF2628)